jgi:hypothetical protein
LGASSSKTTVLYSASRYLGSDNAWLDGKNGSEKRSALVLILHLSSNPSNQLSWASQ